MGSIANLATQSDDPATSAPSNAAPTLDKLNYIKSLLSPSEVIIPSNAEYAVNTSTWSAAKNLKPQLCIRPTTHESLSRVVKYLAGSSLDFNVRSQGFGSSSAKDVLISLSAFNDFHWDPKEETVTLGAGAPWQKYYDEMDKVAPDYTIVCVRTPSIGVGGSTLCSGFSWLSHEFGCASDEANMLDAQVVLLDGTITWLRDTPHSDLLWALRGTQGGFAIVTNIKFRARKYPEQGNIWGGAILIPRRRVKEVVRGILGMEKRSQEGGMEKVAMFLYVMRKELLAFMGADQDMLLVHTYDALGEEHGRKAFEWALSIEGAVDQTKGGMRLRDVAMLQEHIGDLKGTASNYWQPLALTALTEDILLNAVEWWESMLSEANSVRENGYLLFELFSCRDSLTGRGSSAWPRPVGYKQMVLLGSGCKTGASDEEMAIAKKYIMDAPEKVLGKGVRVDVIPNAVEEYHDVEGIYGVLGHYERLRGVKRRYDPKNRLKALIKP